MRQMWREHCSRSIPECHIQIAEYLILRLPLTVAYSAASPELNHLVYIRIVSEEWIRQSGAYSTDNDCYHFNWYNLKSTGSGKPPYPGYYALGINAQVLYVNPYKNLIMVRMGMTNRKYVFIPELFEQLSNFGLF